MESNALGSEGIINLRRSHPHQKLLVTLDGLYADGMIINLLKALDIRFIITAHETDLTYLYEFYRAAQKRTLSIDGGEHKKTACSWVNGLPLNDAHHNCSVNLLCVEEDSITKKKIKPKYLKFSWITDLEITNKTASIIMQGGRTRWHIENDTFNTLKNQGYQFDHNFGHGKQNCWCFCV